jgi:hypothetical protein
MCTKGFQVVTAIPPAGDYSSAPPNKSSGNLSGMSYAFLYLWLPQKNSASKIPISLSALALNRNPKSSYSRYVEVHLMGIRILAGRRKKAAKTKAIRQELPHPDRQTERKKP